MGADETTPHLLSNRFAEAVGPDLGRADRDRCMCVGHSEQTRPASVLFHTDRQDIEAPGWHRLLALIDAGFVVLADTEGNLFCVIDAGA